MYKYTASVIVPTYNRLDELVMTLDSLVQQNCKYKFEVIVADDGSSVDTMSVIRAYVDKLDIRYCFQKDEGFRAAAARNMGIKLADGEICILVDNGIILHSKAVEAHINIHKSERVDCVALGYVYGFSFDLKPHDEEQIKEIILSNSTDEAIRILDANKMYDEREKYYQALGDDLAAWPAPFVVCWSGNFSARRDILVKVGMFDEFFNTWGGEDQDLGLALFVNNVKYVLVREASSLHFPHTKEHDISVERETEAAKLDEVKAHILSEGVRSEEDVSPLQLVKAMFESNNTQVSRTLVEAGKHRKEKERMREKIEYMYKKYPIRAVELWIAHDPPPIELNVMLQEQRKHRE